MLISAVPKSLEELLEALRCLPGVGAKSAQRMAYHLLERNRDGARRLAGALGTAMEQIGNCRRCRNFSEATLCDLCAGGSRDEHLLCVVETPSDLAIIEQATGYRGLYFVLLGHLSPLDGMGPAELGLDLLQQRLDEEDIQELVIATNPTVEGEATAHYIAGMGRDAGVRATRLAHGVPIGGEIEFIDRSTLAHAFGSRQDID